MAQDREFYAFIVAPSANSKLRKIRISYKFIYGVLAVAGLILVVCGLFGVRLAQHASLEYKLAMVQSANDDLKRENESFRVSYERLNGRLQQLAKLTGKRISFRYGS